MYPQPWGSFKSQEPRSCRALAHETALSLTLAAPWEFWKIRHDLSKSLFERTG